MLLSKDMTNRQVSDLLRSIAASYQIKDEKANRFKIIAYERAADAIEHLSSEVKDIYEEGNLDEVAGIGPSISKHLGEVFEKGKSDHFLEVSKGIPESVFLMLPLEGIGAKTAFKLATKLGIKDLEDLRNKAEAGEIAKLEGFGEDFQARVTKSIDNFLNRKKRLLLVYAEEIANEVLSWLKEEKSIVKADILGSLRRKASSVGDIDIAVATKDPERALERFISYPKAKRTLERGEKKASIILPNGIQVDIMTTDPDSYGSLLQHFTGSKHHNIALREHALKKGLSLSEYGIRKVSDKSENLMKFKNEESFYGYLGLKYIPPELREDAGEIDAASKDLLPKLIELADIKGDLQIHSNIDTQTSHDIGDSSIDEIVVMAEKLNYEYIALTDHNPSKSKHSESDIFDILERRKEIIDKYNYSYMKSVKHRTTYVFNSLEVDILPSGELAISDKALDILDFALVSIHSSFNLNKQSMTKRIINALSHKKVKVWAHPTGRLINKREGVEVDWKEIFSFCKKYGKWIEINADPLRLDLPDTLVKDAIESGVDITLGTDAHSFEGMNNMEFGLSVARRGWAEKKNVINSKSLEEFKKLIF